MPSHLHLPSEVSYPALGGLGVLLQLNGPRQVAVPPKTLSSIEEVLATRGHVLPYSVCTCLPPCRHAPAHKYSLPCRPGINNPRCDSPLRSHLPDSWPHLTTRISSSQSPYLYPRTLHPIIRAHTLPFSWFLFFLSRASVLLCFIPPRHFNSSPIVHCRQVSRIARLSLLAPL